MGPISNGLEVLVTGRADIQFQKLGMGRESRSQGKRGNNAKFLHIHYLFVPVDCVKSSYFQSPRGELAIPVPSPQSLVMGAQIVYESKLGKSEENRRNRLFCWPIAP
jgi:hypothetical protein